MMKSVLQGKPATRQKNPAERVRYEKKCWDVKEKKE
jgi:hypothetical protein